jgi:hypothetical protein
MPLFLRCPLLAAACLLAWETSSGARIAGRLAIVIGPPWAGLAHCGILSAWVHAAFAGGSKALVFFGLAVDQDIPIRFLNARGPPQWNSRSAQTTLLG